MHRLNAWMTATQHVVQAMVVIVMILHVSSVLSEGLRSPADAHLVEDVEVPLALVLAHHPRLLQQEVGDLPTVRLATTAELDLKVLPLEEEEEEEEEVRG